MQSNKNPFFEIKLFDQFIIIEPIELINYDTGINYWDYNWIKTRIYLKGGVFSGEYFADVMTINFEKFKQELISLSKDLSGQASFEAPDEALNLNVKGDGTGQFEIVVKALGQRGLHGGTLSYTMEFDQSFLMTMIYQLNKITKRFPVNY